jgi:hypothetical protein
MYSWLPDWPYAPTVLTFVGAAIAVLGILWISLRQQEVTRIAMGGHSFCYLRPYDDTLAPESIIPLGVFQEGKYPVYDVDLFISDIDDHTPREPVPITVGTLSPGLNRVVTKILLPATGARTFAVSAVSARNGGVTEVLKFEWIDHPPNGVVVPDGEPNHGAWLAAWKVIRQWDWQVVEEHVPPGFPRDREGKINWGLGGF